MYEREEDIHGGKNRIFLRIHTRDRSKNRSEGGSVIFTLWRVCIATSEHRVTAVVVCVGGYHITFELKLGHSSARV